MTKVLSTPLAGFVAAVLLVACAPPDGASQDAAATPSAAEMQVSAERPDMEPVRTVLSQSEQQALTPDEVLSDLREGNRRFIEDRMIDRDWLAQAAATAAGQYPKAVILGCVDSRVPPEIVFDQGIGDLFVGRVAGNFENTDLLGSLEFATKVAGSKAIVVLGHTQCGAIKGAVAGVELGNLTELLENFDEAIARARAHIQAMEDAGVDTDAVVQQAIEENVEQTVADILSGSDVIREMVESGEVAVVGAVYDLASGEVDWLDS